MRRRKEVRKRHIRIINIAKILLTPIFKLKYNYKFRKHKELKGKGPFLILGNHSLGIDPMLMSLSFPFHIYYLATEQIMNLGLLSKLLTYAANPISKTKARSDFGAIRKSRLIASEGGSIGLFPEGNISYTGETNKIDKSIVKFIRLLKLPIILFRFEGLFLTSPRWSVRNKKSYSRGDIYKIIEFDEYDKLSDEELYKVINDGLYVNAYIDNKDKRIKYDGKDIALGLERLVFIDLNTNIPNSTYTKGDTLYSNDSSFKLKYDHYGYVTNREGLKYDLIDINKMVIKSYLNYYLNNRVHFEVNAKVYKNIRNKKKCLGRFDIVLNNDQILINKRGNLYKSFKFNEELGLAIQGKRQIIIYDNDETWLIRFDLKTSPYQFLLTYQFNRLGDDLNERSKLHQFGL